MEARLKVKILPDRIRFIVSSLNSQKHISTRPPLKNIPYLFSNATSSIALTTPSCKPRMKQAYNNTDKTSFGWKGLVDNLPTRMPLIDFAERLYIYMKLLPVNGHKFQFHTAAV